MQTKYLNKFLNTKPNLGYGKSYGTFGELLQGILPNQRNFMVTFPIQLFSYAIFIPDYNLNEVIVFPKHKIKSSLLAQSILNYYNILFGGRLIIKSELPEGKGLASSSADLIATAYAVARSFNFKITEETIAQLICPIEPSDGIMYQGIVSFYYKELKLIEYIGSLPSIVILAIDEGGEIDTIEYNSKQKFYSQKDVIKYENMLYNMTKAIQNKDLNTVGIISTESAIMNQKKNPKEYLKYFIKISNELNILGVAVAHSGTFIGLLLDPLSINFVQQKLLCLEKLRKLNNNISMFYSIDFNQYIWSNNTPTYQKSL